MLIRTSLPFSGARPRPANRAEADASQEAPSFKETALKSTIVGASLGTVAGEVLGQGAMLASGGYLGYRLGQHFGGSDVAGVVGAVVGAGAALMLERKVPIGGTVGSVGGFLTGGIVGGVTGCVVGGVQAVAHSNFFKKG